MKLLSRVLLVLCAAVVSAQSADPGVHKENWIAWRGPLQNGSSLESYSDYKFNTEPVWTDDIPGRGTPVIYNGRMYSWGYRGETTDLEEVLQARDEKTGDIIWEKPMRDFLSDTVYNRYTIGAAAIDTETENVISATTYGVVTCYTKDGDIVWQHSMVERFGRLTFPNGRAGAPVIDGDICIIRGVTSYWGADGPARDRFFGFDKNTGELLWSSTPGVGPPYLKDSSFSNPTIETRNGKRVFYAGTGCGNIVCVDVNDGTPLWRYQISKGGVNSSPVIYKDMLICVHGAENLDTTEAGRMFAIKLPADYDNPGGEVDPDQGGAPRLPADVEVWRHTIEMFTSSPTLADGKVYQFDKTGTLYCYKAETGEVLWEKKLSNEQLHSSPVYADGKLYAPMYPGEFVILDVTGEEHEFVEKIKLDGNCIGSPALCNGKVYVHTTEKLYCFEIENSGITWADMPEDKMPEAGEASKLLSLPTDVLLQGGASEEVKLYKADANGVRLGEAGVAEWNTFIPPTARVKATMDASFEGNTISAADDAALSAGAWKGEADGLTGFVRGRVISNIPYTEDFETGYELGDKGFDFPPLPWIGARLKWEVRELEGNKVLQKTLDRVLFQRSLSFIGHPDLSNYTVKADVMTDGNRRIKSVVGLINQRYIISLVGNSNKLEVSSNYERFEESVPFSISPNKWYTLKTRVDVAEDGSGVVRAKAWVKGEPEPDAWTIEAKHDVAHKKGAPGLFGFAPQSQKTVYIDNIEITSNE
ncbi:MAG: hypothetical protein CMO55_03060 [Verrucomicrobiales bacterium]|nr:hypothetical protein [Verrucomicrobiales bacterium]